MTSRGFSVHLSATTRRGLTLAWAALFALSMLIQFAGAPAPVRAIVVPDNCGYLPLDVVVILDNSGSMTENNGIPGNQGSDQDRAGWAKTAIEGLIDALQNNGGVGTGSGEVVGARHRVGLTKYNGTTAVNLSDLAENNATDTKALIPASGSGNTPFKTGMSTGALNMTDHDRTTDFGEPVTQVIVFLSDGRPVPDDSGGVPPWGDGSSQRPTSGNATSFLGSADEVFSIAIGSGGGTGATTVDLALMQELDKPSTGTYPTPGAHYANVLSASALEDFFDDIFQTIACPEEPAHLTLVKVVDSGDADETAWTLTADGATTDLSGTSGVSGDVPAGTYTLTESAGPDFYVPSSWDCGNAALVGNTVTLEPDETATCTIHNRYSPPPPDESSITIVKETIGGDGEFDFELAYCEDGCNYLGDPWDFSISTSSGSGDRDFEDVKPGWYVVEETDLPSGWTLTGAWCTGQQPQYDLAVSLSVVNNPLEFYVDEGQNITCYFTNTKDIPPPSGGWFRISKTVNGDLTGWTGGEFLFTATCGGAAQGGVGITIPAAGGSSMSSIFGPFAPGTSCTVSETTQAPAGAGASWAAPAYSPAATVVIVTGQTVVVTVTNTRTVTPPPPPPSQEVRAETDRPNITLPPTDGINGGDQAPSNPGFGLMLTLLVLAGIGLVAGQFASKARRPRREEVRRR